MDGESDYEYDYLYWFGNIPGEKGIFGNTEETSYVSKILLFIVYTKMDRSFIYGRSICNKHFNPHAAIGCSNRGEKALAFSCMKGIHAGINWIR